MKAVGISFDEGIENLVETIYDKRWNQIQHFRKKDQTDMDSTLKLFDKVNLPFFLLINSNGKIAYSGKF